MMVCKIKMTSNNFLYFVFLLVIAACSGTEDPSDISPIELLSRINDKAAPFILDVRSADEYNGGHVPGAVNIDYSRNNTDITSLGLKKSDEIVIYCESGYRAGKVKKQMEKQGFYEVRHLQGDMRGWRKANLVIE